MARSNLVLVIDDCDGSMRSILRGVHKCLSSHKLGVRFGRRSNFTVDGWVFDAASVPSRFARGMNLYFEDGYKRLFYFDAGKNKFSISENDKERFAAQFLFCTAPELDSDIGRKILKFQLYWFSDGTALGDKAKMQPRLADFQGDMEYMRDDNSIWSGYSRKTKNEIKRRVISHGMSTGATAYLGIELMEYD
jgi:hypothetical protein